MRAESDEGQTDAFDRIIISFTSLLWVGSCRAVSVVTMPWLNFVSHNAGEFLSMVLVGALWGCTNPLLRKGSVEATAAAAAAASEEKEESSSLGSFFRTFVNFNVWIPYVLNQSGSLVFYFLLRDASLSMAVPTCNALALIFSFVTSLYLGERIHKPVQTFMGATLIMVGVAICVASQKDEDETADKVVATKEKPEL
jgi:hypothetical protein